MLSRKTDYPIYKMTRAEKRVVARLQFRANYLFRRVRNSNTRSGLVEIFELLFQRSLCSEHLRLDEHENLDVYYLNTQARSLGKLLNYCASTRDRERI